MTYIQATQQQLIAIANRMTAAGDIIDMGQMHGHRWIDLNYNNRKVQILTNSERGIHRIVGITDWTLGQAFATGPC